MQRNRQGFGQDGTAQVELWRQRADLCRGHGDELGEAALDVGHASGAAEVASVQGMARLRAGRRSGPGPKAVT